MKTSIPALALAFTVLLASGCKDKNKKDPEPQPQPVSFGTINIKVTPYDKFGNVSGDAQGFKVRLVEGKKSALTDPGGLVSFSDLTYGYHTPEITKDGYEGPLVTIYLDKPAYHASFPAAEFSPFKPENINGKVFGKDNVFLSFNLNPAPAQGDSVKVAVIASAFSDMSPQKYSSVDLIHVATEKTTDYNISSLPEFRAMLAGLDSAATFYVSAVPVSYGLFNGNLQEKPQLLGMTPAYPGHVALTKFWKN